MLNSMRQYELVALSYFTSRLSIKVMRWWLAAWRIYLFWFFCFFLTSSPVMPVCEGSEETGPAVSNFLKVVKVSPERTDQIRSWSSVLQCFFLKCSQSVGFVSKSGFWQGQISDTRWFCKDIAVSSLQPSRYRSAVLSHVKVLIKITSGWTRFKVRTMSRMIRSTLWSELYLSIDPTLPTKHLQTFLFHLLHEIFLLRWQAWVPLRIYVRRLSCFNLA